MRPFLRKQCLKHHFTIRQTACDPPSSRHGAAFGEAIAAAQASKTLT